MLLVVTAGKDGALVGGDKFSNAVTERLVDSIVTANIPIFTEARPVDLLPLPRRRHRLTPRGSTVLPQDEKYNEATESSVNRIIAKLEGKEDPGAPERPDGTRVRTYRTKEETEKARNVTGTVVATLLVIAFIVPMLQYYGQVQWDDMFCRAWLWPPTGFLVGTYLICISCLLPLPAQLRQQGLNASPEDSQQEMYCTHVFRRL